MLDTIIPSELFLPPASDHACRFAILFKTLETVVADARALFATDSSVMGTEPSTARLHPTYRSLE